MPMWDYLCENCGHKFKDVFCHSRDEMVKCDLCEIPLTRLIGAPAPPRVRVGKWGDPRSKREQAVKTRKKMLKRSYDHEFSKRGKGVEERRAHIEDLKKKGVPVAGHHGF